MLFSCKLSKRTILFVVSIMCLLLVTDYVPANAAEMSLPLPNVLLKQSDVYSFPLLKGVKFNPMDPLNIEFIFDRADQKNLNKGEAKKLIEYFMAGLTIPEEDLWVNLSPYESDRIAPDSLSSTDLGSDMLGQDYILKQLSSSLTYPESEIGQEYWNLSKEIASSTNSFNKIWIVPASATMYEEATAGYVINASLEALTEADYFALNQNQVSKTENNSSSSAIKKIIIPRLNEELKSGKNFATLRQMHNSLLLAMWFKKKFADTFYKDYFNQAKTSGIDATDPQAKDKTFMLYCEAFKSGVYNFQRKERNAAEKLVKRNYFSGGVKANLSSSIIIWESNKKALLSSFKNNEALSLFASFNNVVKDSSHNSSAVTVPDQAYAKKLAMTLKELPSVTSVRSIGAYAHGGPDIYKDLVTAFRVAGIMYGFHYGGDPNMFMNREYDKLDQIIEGTFDWQFELLGDSLKEFFDSTDDVRELVENETALNQHIEDYGLRDIVTFKNLGYLDLDWKITNPMLIKKLLSGKWYRASNTGNITDEFIIMAENDLADVNMIAQFADQITDIVRENLYSKPVSAYSIDGNTRPIRSRDHIYHAQKVLKLFLKKGYARFEWAEDLDEYNEILNGIKDIERYYYSVDPGIESLIDDIWFATPDSMYIAYEKIKKARIMTGEQADKFIRQINAKFLDKKRKAYTNAKRSTNSVLGIKAQKAAIKLAIKLKELNEVTDMGHLRDSLPENAKEAEYLKSIFKKAHLIYGFGHGGYPSRFMNEEHERLDQVIEGTFDWKYELLDEEWKELGQNHEEIQKIANNRSMLTKIIIDRGVWRLEQLKSLGYLDTEWKITNKQYLKRLINGKLPEMNRTSDILAQLQTLAQNDLLDIDMIAPYVNKISDMIKETLFEDSRAHWSLTADYYFGQTWNHVYQARESLKLFMQKGYARFDWAQNIDEYNKIIKWVKDFNSNITIAEPRIESLLEDIWYATPESMHIAYEKLLKGNHITGQDADRFISEINERFFNLKRTESLENLSASESETKSKLIQNGGVSLKSIGMNIVKPYSGTVRKPAGFEINEGIKILKMSDIRKLNLLEA